MQLFYYSKVYFLGIGGIGMSALAKWFRMAGYQVAGYDRAPSEITNDLINKGIPVSFNDNPEFIPVAFKGNVNKILVIYTPAIPETHGGYQFFKQNGYSVMKRSQALGLIVKDKNGIAVAGTHGKTSVSTMVTNIMRGSADGCSAFLGGIAKNFISNVVVNPESDWVVVEADEFDRSFLTLYPQIAVITSMDADHLDIYDNHNAILEAFQLFANQIKPGGALLLKQGLILPKLESKKVKVFTYSVNQQADYYPLNIELIDGLYHFTLKTPKGEITGLSIGTPGLYNLENGVAAAALAHLAGATQNDIRSGLKYYSGVKRRFDVQYNQKGRVYIDDYAHHPEEIKACYNSLRALYPDKTIAAVFQPHLFSRTRDFAHDFAKSLDLFDEIFLTDIYPARELPIEGITGHTIFNLMENSHKYFVSYDQILTQLEKSNAQILVTMGAGDIDKLVKPITDMLNKKSEDIA